MKLELSLHAIKLKNVAGLMNTSDPFCVVTTMPGPTLIGKTETIHNTLNPNWAHVFILDYELGEPLKIICSIFDQCKNNKKISMGSALFDVGELLGSRGNTKAKRLPSHGTLYAHVRKSTGSGLCSLQLAASNLTNTEGMLRKSDPFWEVSRLIQAAGGQTWDNVHRSNTVSDNLNPKWERAVLPIATLCGGDMDLPIQITVYDHESKGNHVVMGRLETTLNHLVAKVGDSIELTKAGEKTGNLKVLEAELSGLEEDGVEQVTEAVEQVSVSSTTPYTPKQATPTFVDYVAGGCELNVAVALDFTGSNGDPRKPGTLHHLDDNSDNDYEKAISSIVEILSKYDSDQSFPVLGFGAKYDGVVRHCFQCGNGDARGVAGVLQAYRSVFSTGLIMSSPTDFTEVIQTAASRSQKSLADAQAKGGLAYTILLIVSDGAVTDVNKHAELLKSLGDVPLSIVIVGVGNADFGSMQFLDDLQQTGRDLVQFVEFNKHPHKRDLTRATLHEIPHQLTKFFLSRGIEPRPAVMVEEEEIAVEVEEEEIDLSVDFEEEEIVLSGPGLALRGSDW